MPSFAAPCAESALVVAGFLSLYPVLRVLVSAALFVHAKTEAEREQVIALTKVWMMPHPPWLRGGNEADVGRPETVLVAVARGEDAAGALGGSPPDEPSEGALCGGGVDVRPSALGDQRETGESRAPGGPARSDAPAAKSVTARSLRSASVAEDGVR